MKVLVTGAAGFIGFHAAAALAKLGCQVVGLDNFNPYYRVDLKRDRAAALAARGVVVASCDLSDHARVAALMAEEAPAAVLHLAAQAGVRYSLENPFAYVDANVHGHVSVLEAARRLPHPPHVVYASSSSVYGRNTVVPFREDHPVERPSSLYAATKRADELLSETYAHLYGLSQTGLRFFTVYGPWGRPDMAYWLFTEALFEGRPIRLFNGGEMRRDFTFIDDVVDALVKIVTTGPVESAWSGEGKAAIYNIGNTRPEPLSALIAALEAATARTALTELAPMQPGDVVETYADVSRLAANYGYAPKTNLAEGIAQFVDWYRSWRPWRP